MRLLSYAIAFATFAIALACLSTERVRSAEMNVIHCPHFTSTTWVNHEGKSGNRYGLIVVNNAASCDQAITWAKKLMSARSSSQGMLPYEVSGGPAGFHCYLTPDGSGHSIGGTCQKKDSAGNLVSSFDWLPVTE